MAASGLSVLSMSCTDLYHGTPNSSAILLAPSRGSTMLARLASSEPTTLLACRGPITPVPTMAILIGGIVLASVHGRVSTSRPHHLRLWKRSSHRIQHFASAKTCSIAMYMFNNDCLRAVKTRWRALPERTEETSTARSKAPDLQTFQPSLLHELRRDVTSISQMIRWVTAPARQNHVRSEF